MARPLLIATNLRYPCDCMDIQSEITSANAAAPSDFENEVYDFPTATAPRLFYMIASTPRSGGTFPSQCLWRTGLMGAPHEYFGFYGTMLRTVSRLKAPTLDNYLSKLLVVRTPANGVFGFKAHYDHLQFMLLVGLLSRLGSLRWT